MLLVDRFEAEDFYDRGDDLLALGVLVVGDLVVGDFEFTPHFGDF